MRLSVLAPKKRYLLSWFFALSLALPQISLAQPPQPIVKYSGKQQPGYYFLVPFKMSNRNATPSTYLMVLNEIGELVFYKQVPAASDFKLHPNGLISYFSRNTRCLLNSRFELIDSVSCVNGIKTDAHDFLILNNGHYVLMGKESIQADYSALHLFMNNKSPGSKNAKVEYGVIQELDENKKLVFEWRSLDSFRPENAYPAFLNDSLQVDLTHFNSVDVDPYGNFLISARYFNEVFKVNRQSGKIMWRLGGKDNTVKVSNDTTQFLGQHDAHYTSANRFTIFDNGYIPEDGSHNARALEYEIYDGSGIARVIWQYSNPIRIVSRGTGNVQRFANGNTLVNYGQIETYKPNIMFEVVTTAGKSLLSIRFKDTLGTYRAFFYDKKKVGIPSDKLVRFKHLNQTYLRTAGEYSYYIWNTGETAQQIIPKKPGEYYVYVSNDGNSYARSEKMIVR
jgi:hypothetical protein